MATAHAAPAPAVTLLTPVEGSTVGEQLTLKASAPEGTSVYYRVLGPGQDIPTLLGPFTTAPFTAEYVATYDQANPAVWVEALTCDDDLVPTAADGCVGQKSAANAVLSQLNPDLLSATTRFSPNGDGKYDTATIKYFLDVPSAASLTVRNSGGTVVGSVNLGAAVAAGEHTLNWKGTVTTPAGATKTLPAGSYTVGVDTSAPLGDSLQLGSSPDRRTVTIDLSARAGLSVDGAVFPTKDDYRDTLRVDVSTGEAGTYSAKILSPKGKTVRTFSGSVSGSGDKAISWSGRDSKSKILPAGKYKMTVAFTDKVGNKKSASTSLTVDGRHLEKRTGSRTVNPTNSLTNELETDCGYVFPNFLDEEPGSLGLSTESYCVGSYDYNIAASEHAVRLPKAVKYGSVKVAVNGTNVYPLGEVMLALRDGDGEFIDNNDKAAVLLYGADNASTGYVSFRTLGSAPVVRWSLSAHDGAGYVAESFKVTYTYYVLTK